MAKLMNLLGKSFVPAAARQRVPAVIASESGKRLVFGVDATASRGAAWEAAQKLTDALFAALPGACEIALAVHGGNHLHTFTAFSTDVATIREQAERIRCEAGRTQLIPLLRQSYIAGGVGTILYIGDAFEEDEQEALAVATILAKRGTRVITLYDKPRTSISGRADRHHDIDPTRAFFQKLATVTNGAVLPFDITSLDALRDLLRAIAVLTVRGVAQLKSEEKTSPGARLLLHHIKS